MRKLILLFVLPILGLFFCSCKKEPELDGLNYYNVHNYVFEQGNLLIQKTTSFGFRFWLDGECLNTGNKWNVEISGDYPDLHYHFKPYSWDEHDELFLEMHFIDKKTFTGVFSPNQFSAKGYSGIHGNEKLVVTIPSGKLTFTVNDVVLDKNGDAILDKY